MLAALILSIGFILKEPGSHMILLVPPLGPPSFRHCPQVTYTQSEVSGEHLLTYATSSLKSKRHLTATVQRFNGSPLPNTISVIIDF